MRLATPLKLTERNISTKRNRLNHPNWRELHELTITLTLTCKTSMTRNVVVSRVRVLENLESPGILLWYFPLRLERPGKTATGPGKDWKFVKLK